MENGKVLHEAAATHYAEAKDHRRVPLEWHPDEQEQLVQLLLHAEAEPQGKENQVKIQEDWVVHGPGFKEPMCNLKRLAKSDAAAFKEKHLERIKAALKNVQNDKPDVM